MQILLLLFVLIFQNAYSERIRHSYRVDDPFRSREETVLTNITVDTKFQLNFTQINEWKQCCTEKMCFLAGLHEKSVVIDYVSDFTDTLHHEPYTIDIASDIKDFVLFTNWNRTTLTTDSIIVIVKNEELIWYKLQEKSAEQIWSFSLEKNILHLNIFQIDHDLHFFVITKHQEEITGDLYVFELDSKPNFWLREKIPLENSASTSSLVYLGPDYFLSIPQKDKVTVYKSDKGAFSVYQHISSSGVDQTVSFTIGYKHFLAINGLDAGIFQFTKQGMIESTLHNSNLHGINFWLPISTSMDFLLLAQRSLQHEPHNSLSIDVITFDGVKFEEHEDIHCNYYGEKALGTHCLPGEANQHGIKGSTSFLMSNIPLLLIPRDGLHSELFMLNVTKRKIPSPIELEVEKMIKLKSYLNNLLEEQEKRYTDFQNEQIFSDARDAEDFPDLEELSDEVDGMTKEIKAMNEKLSQIEEKQLNFTRVIFNGIVEIPEIEEISEIQADIINGVPANVYLDQLKQRQNVSVENLTLDSLTVNSLNGIEARNLIFQGDELVIQDDLELAQPLAVFGNATAETVNGLKFESEIVNFDKPCDETLVFEHIRVPNDVTVENLNNFPMVQKSPVDFVIDTLKLDTLYIPGNIVTENVNGEDFEQFLEEICLTNIDNYIPGPFLINGNVTIEENAEITMLNGLQFPRDYVLTEDTFPNISGSKTFDSLEAKHVNCELINGIDPAKVLTLSSDQFIPGNIIFDHLEITESLKVDGKVLGEHASKFLPNPTLLETNLIKANVNFKELEVQGSIIISENLMGQNLLHVLNDIVYQNETEVAISAMKEFPEGFSVKHLQIESNTINNIALDSILTKDTEQSLKIDNIFGSVHFHNLHLGGLVNSINVTKLDEETVKTTGEQFISSTLIFDKGLQCSELQIHETVNDLTEEEFLEQQDLDIRSFNRPELNVDAIEVEGNFTGTIEHFDIDEFDQKRLSYSREQTIQAAYNVSHLSVVQFQAVFINGVPSHELSEDFLLNQIENNLIEGKIKATNLYVNSLQVDEINNQCAANLGGSMWNRNGLNLTIHGNVDFEQVQIVNLSKVNFQRFVSNLVFKNESTMEISGNKTFAKPLTVEKLIQTEEINNIPVQNILTKYGVQEVTSPLVIHGNVTFEDNVTILNDLNDISLKYIQENYEMLDHNHCKIKGDVVFRRLAHVNNLQVTGFVNGKKPNLEAIILKNFTGELGQEYIFKNLAEIGDLRVDTTNGRNMSEFLSQIAYISQESTIKAPVTFNQSVDIKERLNIHGDLETKHLNGIDLKDWMDRAVFIDRGLLKGNFVFTNAKIINNLAVKHVNDKDMQFLIPLRSNQDLPAMSFAQVTCYNNISVGNSTNSYHLLTEYNNTLLLNSDQILQSEVKFFGDVFVEGSVHLKGTINGIQVDKIVTTNTDQNLTANFNFKSKITVENEMAVKGLVNGIDIVEWDQKAVKTMAPYEQQIKNAWTIRNDLSFTRNVQGEEALINGIDMKKFLREVEERKKYKYDMEKDLIENYINICKDLTFIYDELKTQHYKFNYFESLQFIKFDSQVEQVHHFTYFNEEYLLISEEHSCNSHLYRFSQGQFIFLLAIPMGEISQIITVKSNRDFLYFVVRNKNIICNNLHGSNIWQLSYENGIFAKHIITFEPAQILQESLIPGTFYGLSNGIVTEYQLTEETEPNLRIYRTWGVFERNAKFVPRGLSTGLALSTGTKMIKLHRDEAVLEDFDYDTEIIIKGNFTIEASLIPSDLIVFKVGTKSTKRSLAAVLSREPTSIKGSLDFIKIYEDVLEGHVFQKLPAHNPHSLLAMDFDNGETFLMFIEDGSVLQVYEYKGILGFQHRTELKLEGNRIFSLTFPALRNGSKRRILGIANGNAINFMEAVMLGNQIEENLHCNL